MLLLVSFAKIFQRSAQWKFTYPISTNSTYSSLTKSNTYSCTEEGLC